MASASFWDCKVRKSVFYPKILAYDAAIQKIGLWRVQNRHRQAATASSIGYSMEYLASAWSAMTMNGAKTTIATSTTARKQTMKTVELHVGYEPAKTRARFLDAIRRAESGDITPQSHVTFESWNGLSRVLSAKRIELLRHVHRTPAATIADVARALGRDYKRVHEDVELLAAAGLLDRTAAGGVHAAYDELRTVIDLTSAPRSVAGAT